MNTKCEVSLSENWRCSASLKLKRKTPRVTKTLTPPPPTLLSLSPSPSLFCYIKASLMTLEASRSIQGIIITKWQTHIHRYKKGVSIFPCLPQSVSLLLSSLPPEIGFVQEQPLSHPWTAKPAARIRDYAVSDTDTALGKFPRNLASLGYKLRIAFLQQARLCFFKRHAISCAASCFPHEILSGIKCNNKISVFLEDSTALLCRIFDRFYSSERRTFDVDIHILNKSLKWQPSQMKALQFQTDKNCLL